MSWRQRLWPEHWRRRLWPDWFGGNVAVASAARVGMSAARALAGVVVPVYLALVGYSALRLGVLFVVVGVATALMSTTVGYLADRWGRKWFLVVVPLLAAAAGLAYAASLDPVVVFGGAAIGSFGRGGGAGGGTVGPYAPAEQALVAGSVLPRHRTAAFGRLAFGSSLGAVLGNLLVPVLVRGHPAKAHALAAYRPAFVALACCALAAALLGLLLTERQVPRPGGAEPGGAVPNGAEPGGAEREPGPSSRTSEPTRLRRSLLPRASRPLLYRLWIASGINGTAVGMFGPFVSYWFYRRYGVSAGTIGELYAVINICTTASNFAAASFARRMGLVRATSTFRAAQALLLVPMVLAPTFAVAGVLYLVRMLAQRVSMPLQQSYVMGLAPPEERARVAALSRLSSQATSSGSPALAGALFDHVALAAPFLVGAFVQLVSAATFFALFRRRPPSEEVQVRPPGPPGAPPGISSGHTSGDVPARVGVGEGEGEGPGVTGD